MAEFRHSIGRLHGKRLAPSLPVGQIEAGYVESPHMLSGMITRLRRDQIPITSGELYRNMRLREEWAGRRPGTGLFVTVPNVEAVLAVITFVTEAKDVYVCRITENTFNVANAAVSGWTPFTIKDADGNPASFPPRARFTFCQFFDKLYLADGTNPIWEVDFGHHTVTQIEGAPRPRYIMTFAERIVAANLRLYVGGVRPATYAYCVNADPHDWTGFGSGQEDLGYDNIGDEITGLVSLDQGASVIVRRRSLYSLTRQPFQQPLFRTDKLLTGYGSDLPHSIVRVPGGFIFADQATRGVYYFSFGSGVQSLSDQVTRELYEDIENLDFAQGAYDLFEREYHLGIVGAGELNITRVWVLSLANAGWTFDDSPEVTCIGLVSLPGEGIAIDDLPGTIDSLVGTIDELGENVGYRETVFKGTADGKVLSQSYDFDNDHDGTKFEEEFISPNLGNPSRRRSLKAVGIRTLAEKGGQYKLDMRNEKGDWRNLKVDTLPASDDRTNIRIPKKAVEGEDLFFRVRSTAPGIRHYSWWVRVHAKGIQT